MVSSLTLTRTALSTMTREAGAQESENKNKRTDLKKDVEFTITEGNYWIYAKKDIIRYEFISKREKRLKK